MDQKIRKRAKALVDKGHDVLAAYDRHSFGSSNSAIQKCFEWRSQALVFLSNVYGNEHTYTKSFSATVQEIKSRHINAGIGILQAVLEDIKQGFIDYRSLIAAEVFSDLFEQAQHLLESGYRAPAASLAGAVLENGLRSIASRKGVTVKAKDDLSSLTQKLVDKGVFSPLHQKRLSFFIGVRNAADHGEFDKLRDKDVHDLIDGTQSLLAEF